MILNKIASFSYMLLLLLTSCINNNQTLFPNENYFDSGLTPYFSDFLSEGYKKVLQN